MSLLAHHAYCLVGDRGLCGMHAHMLLEEHGCSVHANPDVVELFFDSLGVDDARMVIERQSSRALQGEHKVFIIHLHTATTEAQNALLKVIEEPAPSTQFIFSIPTLERLLPTIKSRIFTVDVGFDSDRKEAQKFVQATIAERLKIVEGIAKAIKDEKEDREVAVTLCRGVEEVLGQNSEKYAQALKEVLPIKRALMLRGASVKQLLEQLALVL